jgi:hypothetical protein
VEKICGLCGKQYSRKIEHTKRSHRTQAYKQFRSLYIDEINKLCQICQNIKPLSGKLELHILRKHLGRAAKEFAQTF